MILQNNLQLNLVFLASCIFLVFFLHFSFCYMSLFSSIKINQQIFDETLHCASYLSLPFKHR